MKSLEDNVTVYETSEEQMKKQRASAIGGCTRLSQVVDDILAEVVDLRERFWCRGWRCFVYR